MEEENSIISMEELKKHFPEHVNYTEEQLEKMRFDLAKIAEIVVEVVMKE